MSPHRVSVERLGIEPMTDNYDADRSILVATHGC